MTDGGGAETPKIAALPVIESISAGPDADRHANRIDQL
jgi:hypothetical protein